MKTYIVEDIGTYRGFTYCVLGLDLGHRCGYVRIPSDHYLFNRTYSEHLSKPSYNALRRAKIGKRGVIPLFCADGKNVTMDLLFNVHGSITFAGDFSHIEKTHPQLAGYWIGFDCAHAGDAPDPALMSPEYKKVHEEMSYFTRLQDTETIRTTSYCVSECKSLIRQIIKFYPQP